MEQREINQQVFAHLTVQNMLLKELCLALFSVHEDKGDRFMAQAASWWAGLSWVAVPRR